jgi:hypothetical protein
VLFTQ